MAEQLQNLAESTLTADPGAAGTTFSVADGSTFPASGNFRVTCENEIALCTSRTGNDLTVTRGQEGTTGVAHASGKAVVHTLTKGGLDAYHRAIDPVDDQTGWTITGADHDFTWNKGNSSSVYARISGSATGSVRSIGVPDYGNGTRLLIRSIKTGGTHTLTHLGTVSPKLYLIGGADRILDYDDTIEFYYQDVGGGNTYWMEVNSLGLYRHSSGYVTSLDAIEVKGATSGDYGLGTLVAGDTNARFYVTAGGVCNWGPGNAAQDVNLYRAGASSLKTDDSFTVAHDSGIIAEGSSTAQYAFRAYVAGGGGSPEFLMNSDGMMNWGDGTAAGDTNLYRAGASILKTDDSFQVVGDIALAWNGSNYLLQSSSDKLIIGSDTNLYRSAADTLKTDDNFEALTVKSGGSNVVSYATMFALT